MTTVNIAPVKSNLETGNSLSSEMINSTYFVLRKKEWTLKEKKSGLTFWEMAGAVFLVTTQLSDPLF